MTVSRADQWKGGLVGKPRRKSLPLLGRVSGHGRLYKERENKGRRGRTYGDGDNSQDRRGRES